MDLLRWTDVKIDPATIPDVVIASEHGKRNARKRWAKHNPTVSNCRCKRCTARRAKIEQISKNIRRMEEHERRMEEQKRRMEEQKRRLEER